MAVESAITSEPSTSTGTLIRSMINCRFHGFRMPMPEPMSDASGMTATQPMSSSIFAWIGSSAQ